MGLGGGLPVPVAILWHVTMASVYHVVCHVIHGLWVVTVACWNGLMQRVW